MTSANSNLTALLSPRSVAIIGASADFNKINGRPIRNLLEKGYAGKIFPINPKYDKIGDLTCYPSVEAVPDTIDLAIVILPAGAVVEAFKALGRKKVPAAVVFSAGFGETGPEGKALEQALVETARANNIRLCGPNCLGLINAFDGMLATFSQYADGENVPGPIAFVTQSGAFGTAIAALARNRSLGLGFFVNTGNEADIDFVDTMSALIEDPRVKVGTGYVEGIRNGAGLAALGRRSLELGKPVIVMKVGRTKVGSRAVSSHTGALAGEDAIFDGVAKQFGLIRARNEEEMLDMAQVFAYCDLPKGNGLAIATQSGGAGVQMADRADDLGLKVPVLLAETQEKIGKSIPGFGVATNPIDVTGQFVAQPAILRDSLKLMLTDPQVDIGVVWIELMHKNVDLLVSVFEEVKAQSTKPLVVVWVAAPDAAVKELAKRKIPLLRSGEAAIEAIAGLVQFSKAQQLAKNTGSAIAKPAAEHEWQRAMASAKNADGGLVASAVAMALLNAYGVNFPPATLAATVDDAKAAASTLGYPVALKIESGQIAHKTEVGGVQLNLQTPDALANAWASISASVKAKAPNAKIDGMLVQKMSSGDVEFVIGLQRDPSFGPVIMAGLGGIFIEVLKDVVFRQCPVSTADAEQMLDELHAKAVLDGARGKAPVDRKKLAALIAQVSRFAVDAGPRLSELDLNPIMIRGDQMVAVDALLTLNTQ